MTHTVTTGTATHNLSSPTSTRTIHTHQGLIHGDSNGSQRRRHSVRHLRQKSDPMKLRPRELPRVWLTVLTCLIFSGFSQAQNLTFTLHMDYDNLGRLTQITHPGTNNAQNYSHTDSGAHDSVSYDGNTIVSNTTYNDGGAATRIDFANYGGISGARVDRTYDVLNRLKSLQVNLNGGTQYRAYNLGYNDWGFLSTLRRGDPASNRTFTYSYGSRGELSSMSISGNGTVNYAYDSKGNLTSRGDLDTSEYYLPSLGSVAYNNKNQRSVWDYGPDGKLTRDDTFEYTYNTTEQLESAVDPSTGWDLTHYLYDGTGERVREVVDDSVVYAIRSGGMLVSQEIHQTRIDGGMDITRKDFVYHNGQVILTVTTHPDATVTRQYQYRDRMGHPALVVDEEDGFAPRWNEYSPFGFEMRGALTGITTHEFTGHERDEATGLDYMHARYYDRNFARFTRPDPAFDFNPVNPFSYNLYGYTRNNPINAWDPTGLNTVGMQIEEQMRYHAVQGNDLRGYGLMVLKLGWDLFGMESVSAVTNQAATGQAISKEDAFWATVDTVTLGKGKKTKAAVQGAGDGLINGTKNVIEMVASKSKIRKVGGRKPINSKYAGKVHPSGVRFKDTGFPDFTPYAKAQVEITGLTGNYAKDAAMANKAAGFPRTPDGFVWHHVEDAITMQLIPKDLHDAVRHTGGAAEIRHRN